MLARQATSSRSFKSLSERDVKRSLSHHLGVSEADKRTAVMDAREWCSDGDGLDGDNDFSHHSGPNEDKGG